MKRSVSILCDSSVITVVCKGNTYFTHSYNGSRVCKTSIYTWRQMEMPDSGQHSCG